MDQTETFAPDMPANLDEEFGGDFEQQEREAAARRATRAHRVPAVGEPGKGKKQWNVMVRHSTFLLKQADIWAKSPEEAQKIFVEYVHEHHKTVAARQRGPERDKAAARVMAAYQHGIANMAGFEWLVRPTREVEALNKWLRDKEERAKLRDKQLAPTK